jgi:L-amino acid N-acyltransferase YncA
MTKTDTSFRVRQATSNDAPSLCQILNEIIAIGGTTAFETPLSVFELENHFLSGDDCIVCLLAETLTGEALGFQSLSRNSKLPTGWGDIATFTRREPRTPGIGTALFQSTVAFAGNLGLAAINATIRADNESGIPYYEKMGFKTYDVARGVPLKDGTPVDRISKTYSLGLDRKSVQESSEDALETRLFGKTQPARLSTPKTT